MAFLNRMIGLGLGTRCLICALLILLRPSHASAALQLNLSPDDPAHGFHFVDILPGVRFHQPVAIVHQPGSPQSLFIVERTGKIYAVTNLSVPSKHLFLDLTAQNAAYLGPEAGLLGLAFHPGFETNRTFFVYRTVTEPEPGGITTFFNRLSRFKATPGDPFTADPASEEILIDQRDYEIASHNAGDIHFGPDGYLYLSLGDLSPPPEELARTRQPIDESFFGAIIRIDVDNRRGSLAPNPHPAFRGGYSIPPDNPFIGVTNYHGLTVDPSQVRTEIYALGFRNPWRFTFDPLTGNLWCGDVGESSWEEINLVEKGGNYGWPYREGNFGGFPYTQPPGFESTAPVHAYPHGNGNYRGHAVVGGRFYRGHSIPVLQGDYIFGDNIRGNIWVLRRSEDAGYSAEWLGGEPHVSCFGEDPRDQELLVANLLTGQIKKLAYNDPATSSFPEKLSETGFFADTKNLQPIPELIPYEINQSFWSDFAWKQRWFYLPDGESFGFSSSNHWSFPEGAIWVKHFELETIEGDPSSRKRLETRFIVKTGEGAYGVTYKWNPEGTDALLLPPEGLDEEIEITRTDGSTRLQTWRYPSRLECAICHNEKAGYAIGFTTVQLNRPVADPQENQLDLLASQGYLSGYHGTPLEIPRLAERSDTRFSTEFRARSYFEANCAHCHRPGVPFNAFWDARFHVPMHQKNLLYEPKVKPGDPHDSKLYFRLSQHSVFRMPPIATSEIDSESLRLIEEWMQGMPLAPWSSGDFGSPIARGNASVLPPTMEVAGYAPAAGAIQSAGRFLLQPMQGAGHLIARLAQHNLGGPENKVGLLFTTNALASGYVFAGVQGDHFFVNGTEETDLEPLTTGEIWLRMVNQPTGMEFWARQSGPWARLQLQPASFASNWFGGFAVSAITGNQENYGRFENVSFFQVDLKVSGGSTTVSYPDTLPLLCSFSGENFDLEGISLFADGVPVGEFVPPAYTLPAPVLTPGMHTLHARARFPGGLTVDSFPITIEVAPPVSGAWSMGTDADSRGNWNGVFGGDGFFAPAFEGLPAYALLSPIQAPVSGAPPGSVDESALLFPASDQRSGSFWSAPEIQFDLDFQDSILHQVSLYFVALDRPAPEQTISVADKFSGAILYESAISDFESGQYLILNLRGSVRIRIHSESSAMLAGIFFDQSSFPPPELELEPLPQTIQLPASVLLQPIVTSTAPLKSITFGVPGRPNKLVDSPPFSLSVTGLLAGEYTFTATAIDLYDQRSAPATAVTRLVLSSPEVRWLGTDGFTRGNWREAYGAEGHLIISHDTNLPPFALMAPAGHHDYQWFIPAHDPLGLESLDGLRRIGATWAAPYDFLVDLSLLDGNWRQVSLYGGFNQTVVQVSDPVSGELLDEQQMIDPGTYYRWGVRGHVQFKFIRQSGAASVNAFFFDRALPFELWVGEHFSEEERANETIAGPTADPDADGDSNLAEYAFGGNPRVPGSLWSVARGLEGQLFLTFEFNNAAIDFQPALEVSPDLLSWSILSPDDPSLQRVLANGKTQFRWLVPASDNRFLRLRLLSLP